MRRTDADRDREVAEWNAALASGDTERIERIKDEIFVNIATGIMDDDPDYAVAGWKPEEKR